MGCGSLAAKNSSIAVRLKRGKGGPTWLSHAHSDSTSLECGTGVPQSFLQSVHRSKLDVAEALRRSGNFVLYDTDVCHIAAPEQVGNVAGGGIKREVANVGSVRRTGRQG